MIISGVFMKIEEKLKKNLEQEIVEDLLMLNI
jgi:hypothetical protein